MEPFAIRLNAEDCGLQWTDHLKVGKELPGMHTDVVLIRENKEEKKIEALIIEAKCYEHILKNKGKDSENKKILHSDDIYQLFAYIMNLQQTLEETYEGQAVRVSGVLLYAKTKPDEGAEGEHKVFGHRMDVDTLDLNQKFEEGIRKKLDQLLCKYLGEEGVKTASVH